MSNEVGLIIGISICLTLFTTQFVILAILTKGPVCNRQPIAGTSSGRFSRVTEYKKSR